MDEKSMKKPVARKSSYLWTIEDQQRTAACDAYIKAQPRLAEVERAMTIKWGLDRLPSLVDQSLRDRFERQRDKLCAAVESQNWVDAMGLLPGMIRGWHALDVEADKLGAQPINIEIKPIGHKGREYRLVETIAEEWSVPAGDYDIISVEALLNLNEAVRSGFIEGKRIMDKGITVEPVK